MEVPTTARTCMCTRTHKHTCKHKHTHTRHSTKTTCYFSKGVAFQPSCIRKVGPSFRDFPDSWSISWPQHYQGLGDFWIHVIDHMVLFFIHLRQSRWVDTSFVIFWKKFGGPGLDIREIHLDLKGSLASEWCHLGAGYWTSLRHTSLFLKWADMRAQQFQGELKESRLDSRRTRLGETSRLHRRTAERRLWGKHLREVDTGVTDIIEGGSTAKTMQIGHNTVFPHPVLPPAPPACRRLCLWLLISLY